MPRLFVVATRTTARLNFFLSATCNPQQPHSNILRPSASYGQGQPHKTNACQPTDFHPERFQNTAAPAPSSQHVAHPSYSLYAHPTKGCAVDFESCQPTEDRPPEYVGPKRVQEIVAFPFHNVWPVFVSFRFLFLFVAFCCFVLLVLCRFVKRFVGFVSFCRSSKSFVGFVGFVFVVCLFVFRV